jgi:hypothetical protein
MMTIERSPFADHIERRMRFLLLRNKSSQTPSPFTRIDTMQRESEKKKIDDED